MFIINAELTINGNLKYIKILMINEALNVFSNYAN